MLNFEFLFFLFLVPLGAFHAETKSFIISHRLDYIVQYVVLYYIIDVSMCMYMHSIFISASVVVLLWVWVSILHLPDFLLYYPG